MKRLSLALISILLTLTVSARPTLAASSSTSVVSTSTFETVLDVSSVRLLRTQIQADGKVLVLGQYFGSFDCESGALLIRLLPDGSLDKTFGQDGIRLFPKGAVAWITGIVQDSRGRSYTLGTQFHRNKVPSDEWGYECIDQPKTALLMGLLPTGALDNNFGVAGVVSLSAPEISPEAQLLTQLPNNAFVLTSPTGQLISINSDGSINRRFGDRGFVSTKFDIIRELFLSDGKLYIAGIVGERAMWGLTRFSFTGQEDTRFLKATSGIYSSGDFMGFTAPTTLMPARFILAGSEQRDNGVAVGRLVAVLKNGQVDGNYGSAGEVLLPTGVLAGTPTQCGGTLVLTWGAFNGFGSVVKYVDRRGQVDHAFADNGSYQVLAKTIATVGKNTFLTIGSQPSNAQTVLHVEKIRLLERCS